MNWNEEIEDWLKNRSVLLCLTLIVIPTIILAFIPTSDIDSNNVNPAKESLGNLLRIVAGAGGGGLLSITIINAGTRRRARHANKAIIARICMISASAYADLTGNNSGHFISNLLGGGFGSHDVSKDINHVIGLLERRGDELTDGQIQREYTEDDLKKACHYSLYKQKIISELNDLINIYIRDDINNTNDEKILEELYHCNDRGLILLGLLEGYGATQKSEPWLTRAQILQLAYFFEVCLPLYRSLLRTRRVSVTLDEGHIERYQERLHP